MKTTSGRDTSSGSPVTAAFPSIVLSWFLNVFKLDLLGRTARGLRFSSPARIFFIEINYRMEKKSQERGEKGAAELLLFDEKHRPEETEGDQADSLLLSSTDRDDP